MYKALCMYLLAVQSKTKKKKGRDAEEVRKVGPG
jgi:hypothetical protein